MNRRRFMQGLGASAAAGVGLASMSSASAVDPVDVLYPKMRVGAGVGAWLGEQIGGLFESDRDLSGYTGSEALWSNSIESLLTLQSTNEQVLSSLENTAEFAPNAILPQAMATAIDGFNSGLDTTEINDMVDDTIEGYVSGVQEDLLTAFQNSLDQLKQIYDLKDGFEPADGDDPIFQLSSSNEHIISLRCIRDGGNFNSADAWPVDSTIEYELVDGSLIDVRVSSLHDLTDYERVPIAFAQDFIEHVLGDWDSTERHDYNTGAAQDDIVDFIFDGDPPTIDDDIDAALDAYMDNQSAADVGDPVIPHNPRRFRRVWEELQDLRIELGNEMGSFVDDFSAAYDEGEVDVSDAVDPITAYTELRAEDDDNAFAGASAGLLGIPTSGTDPMEIELHESDLIVHGSIYAHNSPEGGFTVGERYDPDDLDSAVFLRYSGAFEDEDGNVEEKTDFVQLQQEFTILSALDEDGNEKETVEMVDGPTYDPADLESIEEQLAQVREEQIRLQEQAAQDASGGGFSLDAFDMGPVPGPVVALAAAGLVVYGVITN